MTQPGKDLGVGMVDPEEYERAHDIRSSDEFFKQPKFYESDGKQLAKRGAHLQNLADQLVRDMVTPPSQPGFKSISDTTYLQLMAGGPKVWAEENFEPVANYFHKLAREKNGKITMIRPLYKGEVGTETKTNEYGHVVSVSIIVLESGFGTQFVGALLIDPTSKAGESAEVEVPESEPEIPVEVDIGDEAEKEVKV